MPEMRSPAAPSTVVILLAAAGVLAVAACVPRPAGLDRSSATALHTAAASGEPDATATPGSVGPTPSPSFVRPTPGPGPTFLPYAVRPGDTLTSIARAYRTTPRSIAFWSRGEHPSLDPESAAYEPDRLEVGWILLLIPDSVFDEDELMDVTPSPATQAPSAGASTPGESPSATAG